MKKTKKIDPESLKKLKLDVQFCTECEKDLDDFFLTKKSKDINSVKANHENCKQIGKYNGEMCSKIFIAKLEETDSLDEDFD